MAIITWTPACQAMVTYCDALPHPIAVYATKYCDELPSELPDPTEDIRQAIIDYVSSGDNATDEQKADLLRVTKRAMIEPAVGMHGERLAQVALLLGAQHSISRVESRAAYRLLRQANHPPDTGDSELDLIRSYVWFQYRVLIGEYSEASSGLIKGLIEYKKGGGDCQNALAACISIDLARYSDTLVAEMRPALKLIRDKAGVYSKSHADVLSAWSKLVTAEYLLRASGPALALEMCQEAASQVREVAPDSRLHFECHSICVESHALLRDLDAAEESYAEAESIARRLNPKHYFFAKVSLLNRRARMAYWEQRFAEGGRLALEAHELVKAKLGNFHPFSFDSLVIVSDCSFETKKLSESYWCANWAARCTSKRVNHLWARCLERESRAAFMLGEYESAVLKQAEAVRVLQLSYPKEHPQIPFAKDRLKEMKLARDARFAGVRGVSLSN